MTNAARGEGRIVSQHRLAEQSFGDRSTEQVRDPRHLSPRVQGTLPNQDRDPLPAIQHIGGGAELIH
jgi:hypothetical protein